MKRRDLIAMFAGMTVAWPHAAIAQSTGRLRLIGVLVPTLESDPDMAMRSQELRRELQALGWVGDRNLRTAYRWGGGDEDRIYAYAAELIALAPDVILAAGAPAVAPLRRLTRTVPIVFISVSDPVGQGFVASLAHPGGNITGFSNFDPTTGGTWLRLLMEIAPQTKRVAVLYNRRTAPYAQAFLRSVEDAAASLMVRAIPAPVENDAGLKAVLGAFGSEPGDGLIFPSDAFTYSRYDKIVTLAAQRRLPAIYPFRVFTTNGGLMSYGIDLVEETRQAAHYIDRILSGAKPGDLPVQPPSKFELVINLKTAKALGLDVAPTLLARADEVIE
jgi:putative ABC transport system substrate-binding protein